MHRIPSHTAESEELRPLLRRIQAHAPPDLVEVVEVDGSIVVVTHILPGAVTFEGWLRESAARLGPDPAPAGPGTGSAGGSGGDDYSAYFKIPQQAQSPPPPSPPKPQAPTPPSSSVKEDAYTAFFESARPAGGAPAREGAPEEPATSGGYTDLFPAAPDEREKGPREASSPPPGHERVPTPPDPVREPPKQARTSPPSPNSPGDSITDMFRKPETPSPRKPGTHRQERWPEASKGLPPLRLPLDEYVRKLGYSKGVGRDPRGVSGDGSLDRVGHAPRGSWESAGIAPPPVHETRPVEPMPRRSRDLLILVSILAFVVVVAVVVVLVLLLRGG